MLAAIDPAHRTSPPLHEHWRKPEVVTSGQIRATPGFTGRGDELAAIDAALWARETPALTQSAAVRGFGGVGKSTIAREYAWQVSRFPDVYDGIWWLDAENKGTQDEPSWPGIEQGYIELGDTFIGGLAEQKDRPAAARTGRGFVESAGFAQPWLIVYDNVDHARTLHDWPPPKGAHVIVTSRLMITQKGTTPVEIGTWPLPDAVRFLRDTSGRADMTAAEAQAIAEALGCLPLALAHAAAYLADNDNATPASYLASITHHMREVPESAEAVAPRAVFATLQQNIAQADARAKGAAAVMSLAAHFAPDAIPEELFGQDAEIYPPAFAPLTGDGPALEKAIGALGRLSLVTIDRERKTFSVHRLVQAAARDALGPDAAAWSAAAVAASYRALPDPDDAHWPSYERLVPHVRAAVDRAPEQSGRQVWWLLLAIAEYLNERAAIEEVMLLLQRARSIAERLAKADPGNAGWQRDLSVSHDRIGDVLRAQGNLPAALDAFNASLAIAERLAKADPGNAGWQADLAASHGRIGQLYVAMERPADALRTLTAGRAIMAPLVAASPDLVLWQQYLQGFDRLIASLPQE